jgi:hypothetical protein
MYLILIANKTNKKTKNFMSALVGIQVSAKHGIQPTNELNFALPYTLNGELRKNTSALVGNFLRNFGTKFRRQVAVVSRYSSLAD